MTLFTGPDPLRGYYYDYYHYSSDSYNYSYPLFPRLIQKEILAPLSELILQGKVTENTNICVGFDDDSHSLTFECQPREEE